VFQQSKEHSPELRFRILLTEEGTLQIELTIA
jgi:hypothetical protein